MGREWEGESSEQVCLSFGYFFEHNCSSNKPILPVPGKCYYKFFYWWQLKSPSLRSNRNGIVCLVQTVVNGSHPNLLNLLNMPPCYIFYYFNSNNATEKQT